MSEIFKKNQKYLLWIANTEAGRWLLGANKDDKIVKIFPNGYSVFKDFQKDKIILQAKFFTWNKVSNDFIPLLDKMLQRKEKINEADRLAYYLIDNKYLEEQFLHFKRFATGTFYPPELGNGTCPQRDSGSWAAARDATSCSEAVSTGATTFPSYVEKTGGVFHLYRSFFPFLTGNTLAGTTITAGTFTLTDTGAGKSDAFTESLVLTGSTQTDPTALAQADYDNITKDSPTEFATRITFASWTTTNTYTLNAAGLLAINKTAAGYTKFCTRGSKDVDNSEPTDGSGFVRCYLAAQTGTSEDPVLVVTYTLPGGNTSYALFV